MEYIVSARKYRPASFDAVVGQQALTVTLRNAVVSGKLAHAYLFCGPRGVGKTTCARIFAKVINCLSPRPDGDACGECESCKAFAEQRSLNIFELDAASNNGVEHIKSLMEQTRIPPQVGKYKVFIIDEVHMLSQAAFNAFLKTLEEPPAHVVFILATTEKHKILPTILSRCQVYDFERMTVQNIIGHLKSVAEDQGITYEDEALNLIAEKADGGMRDALSIFDQAASFCQGNITYEKVIEDLNILDVDNYFKALDLALECKVMDEMLLLDGVLSKGFDAGHFITGLASHVRNVLMARDEQTISLIETSETQRAKYAEQARKCNPRFLYDALRILNECDVNYKQSSNKRLLVELAMIEVAQILQKDDDAGVGRGPRKKLKSLFKQLVAATQVKRAQQVAPTEKGSAMENRESDSPANISSTSSGNGMPSTLQPSNAATSTTAAPKLKMAGLGMSFNSILHPNGNVNRNEGEEKKVEKIVENEPFTISDLRLQWISMCNRMEDADMKSLAKRLKNLVPTITTYPAIEILVENEMLYQEINALRSRLEVTMAKHLHNGNIKLTVRVAEAAERKKILSPKETFDMLVNDSDAVSLLVEKLELEIEA